MAALLAHLPPPDRCLGLGHSRLSAPPPRDPPFWRHRRNAPGTGALDVSAASGVPCADSQRGSKRPEPELPDSCTANARAEGSRTVWIFTFFCQAVHNGRPVFLVGGRAGQGKGREASGLGAGCMRTHGLTRPRDWLMRPTAWYHHTSQRMARLGGRMTNQEGRRRRRGGRR